MTTITLHYYNDSVRGLPRLIFFAVPDDFDVWDAPTTRSPRVDIALVLPAREPTGPRNVNININFNTKKLLMYKFGSIFQLAVSEVEFFTCSKLDTAHMHVQSCIIMPYACTYTITSRITDNRNCRRANTTIQ